MLTGCRSDQQWLDCNLQCDQLCLYYEYALQVEGKCTTGRKCVPGMYCILTVSVLIYHGYKLNLVLRSTRYYKILY